MDKQRVFTIIILSVVLLFAASLRFYTFFLPHNHGDQIMYLGLAMKLERFGLSGYNLKGIDVVSNGSVLAVVPSQNNPKGSLLESLEKDNVFYYSKETLSNMPPGFSYLIYISHRIFSPSKLFLSVDRNLGISAIFLRPKNFFKSQFYAVWLNFVFSLLFILFVFLLGRMLFSENVGLWASLLLAISPVDILTSQRLWTDEMVACLITISILLYWLGRKKQRLLFFVGSGIIAGLAALTKQSGAFVIFILIISDFLIRCYECKKCVFSLLFNRELLCVIGCALMVCGFWYVKITSIYGLPWYTPNQKGIEKVASWFIFLAKKPRYGQLYYFVYLLPLFGCFYYEIVRTVLKRMFSPERILCLTWFIVFISILLLIPGKEERYMLPAYPAIAIFTGIVVEHMRDRCNKISHLGDTVTALLIGATSIWSIELGLRAVFDNQAFLLLF